MFKITQRLLTILLLAALIPSLGFAQSGWGPESGDREFTLSGTGTSDKDFDNSSFGLSGDYGWFISDRTSWGIRQSFTYADVSGGGLSNDLFAGSTRGYVDYHFGQGRARPFIGASLGGIYGDGVNSSFLAGAELGLKYYALENTFILARAEYQFLFSSGGSAQDNIDDGAWAYVFGIGFNF